MFNVLPPEEKVEIAKEYKTRRLVVLIIFFVTTLAIATVFIFPSFLTSKINNKDTEESLRALSEELKKGNSHVATPGDIAALRKKITILNSSKRETSVFSLVSAVLGAKSNNIKIVDFSFKKAERDDGTTLSIGGEAKTRDSLTQFARNLEARTEFSAVDLPISNLAKEKDIDFTMTITVRQPN